MKSSNGTGRNDTNTKSLMTMMNNESVIDRAIGCLGKGFDLTNDFRLKYCKGDERLIVLNEDQTTQLFVPGFGTLNELVSVDIKCDKGDFTRHQSDILDFNQMSELLNRKSTIGGKIPSGLFNALFKFESGCWATDAANTNLLGFDGYSLVLFNLHIDRYPLILSDHVRHAVPSTWDPPALARFIEKYGTHIIVGISIGGEDMVLMKQEKSSKVEASELKKHLYELGDQLFTGTCTIFPHHRHRTKHHRQKTPSAFNVFEQLSNKFSTVTSKDGITVICTKRGGDLSVSSHSEWLSTVPSMPDAINFTFIPITSLLKGAPGKGFLSHAINLYLRYKPPIAELHYFLDFQSHRAWAPLHSDLPLTPTTNMPLPASALQFNILGPRLYVNTSQVYVEKKPVTGMRLYLEGKKCDRLAVHLQHLSNTPAMFHNKIGDNLYQTGSDEVTDNERYLEPVQKRRFSHICSAPVKYKPSWSQHEHNNATFIVTGAQLSTKKHGSKHVLHLRLLFSPLSCFKIVESNWSLCEQETSSQRLKFLTSMSPPSSGNLERVKEALIVMDSSQYPSGPPVPIQNQRLSRFVDTSQICRGPQDMPGYWLVTGAKLDLVNGKICLQVKFSLLNI